MAAALWPLVPSLAVFLPKSDAIFPCLGTAFLALWLYGRDRRSPLMCIAAGLVMWLGMFLSLALLPVALLAALLHRNCSAASATMSTAVGMITAADRTRSFKGSFMMRPGYGLNLYPSP